MAALRGGIHDLAAAWVIMGSRDKPGYDGWDEFNQTENALSGSGSLAIRTADHDDIAIRIVQPHFPMLRCRIDVRLFDHVGLQCARTRHRGVEIVKLKPQHDTM